jgi:hypothetical protein
VVRRSLPVVLFLLMPALSSAAGWTNIFNGKDLTGWESIGDGVWTVLRDGTLIGQRDLTRAPWQPSAREQRAWRDQQAWLYTRKDYGEFDLSLEYWARRGGNSGISIRDTSRAKYAIVAPVDFTKTPSKIGYEIQINNLYPDKHPTGSIYTFAMAKPGAQVDDQWNTLVIESREDIIRVRLNGQPVCEHAGDPKRSKTGPIGLQLHDQYSVTMFRNIRLREAGRR